MQSKKKEDQFLAEFQKLPWGKGPQGLKERRKARLIEPYWNTLEFAARAQWELELVGVDNMWTFKNNCGRNATFMVTSKFTHIYIHIISYGRGKYSEPVSRLIHITTYIIHHFVFSLSVTRSCRDPNDRNVHTVRHSCTIIWALTWSTGTDRTILISGLQLQVTGRSLPRDIGR